MLIVSLNETADPGMPRILASSRPVLLRRPSRASISLTQHNMDSSRRWLLQTALRVLKTPAYQPAAPFLYPCLTQIRNASILSNLSENKGLNVPAAPSSPLPPSSPPLPSSSFQSAGPSSSRASSPIKAPSAPAGSSSSATLLSAHRA